MDLNYKEIDWIAVIDSVAHDAISLEFLKLYAAWDLLQVRNRPIIVDKRLYIILSTHVDQLINANVRLSVWGDECTYTYTYTYSHKTILIMCKKVLKT